MIQQPNLNPTSPWTDNNLEASKKQLRFNQLSSGVGIRTNIEIDTIVKTYMSKQVQRFLFPNEYEAQAKTFVIVKEWARILLLTWDLTMAYKYNSVFLNTTPVSR